MSVVATEPGFLTARRERAVALQGSLELPRFRGIPGWEFFELRGLDLDAYSPAPPPERPLPASQALLQAPAGALTLTQVDTPNGSVVAGNGAAELPGPARDGRTAQPLVLPLAEAVRTHPELVEPHLGRLVDASGPFTARNEAGWGGGAFVWVPAGVRCEAPVVLQALQAAAGSAMHWRCLIVLEEGAEAEVWDQYGSATADGDGLFNAVVELSIGPGARLRYLCGQGLGEKAWMFGTQRAEVGQEGSLEWVVLGFGAGRARLRMDTALVGRGASARVTGAYASRGRQRLDFDTTQEHAAPDTTSDLAFRGVLGGRSSAVWRGMIRVDPGAQRTDAFQESRNLLLSDRAHADAIPGLEIEANDVRCTHAAAVAKVDAEQLFYLRSRGLPREPAERLVIDGFMQALVERFPSGVAHDAVAAALERRLGLLLDAG